jgi:hypothetical protein
VGDRRLWILHSQPVFQGPELQLAIVERWTTWYEASSSLSLSTSLVHAVCTYLHPVYVYVYVYVRVCVCTCVCVQ